MTRSNYTDADIIKIAGNILDELNINKTMDGNKLLLHERVEILATKYQIMLDIKLKDFQEFMQQMMEGKIVKVMEKKKSEKVA